MMQVTLDISGAAGEDLERVAARLQRPRGLLRAAQMGVANELRAHFDRRDSEPNKMGWPSRNFWIGIAERVVAESSQVTDSSATVTVASPELAHKITGGTITAKRGGSLTLPASAEAYSAGSPREGNTPALRVALVFDPQYDCYRAALVAAVDYLREVRSGKQAGVLVRAKQSKLTVGEDGSVKQSKSNATQGLDTVWYWLVKSVTQAADPRALPDPAMLETAVREAANDWLESIMGGRAEGSP